jgi:hypothetical protein
MRSLPGRFRPSPPVRRGLALMAVVVVLAVGCTGDNTPKEYNSLVKDSFTGLCTGNVPPIDNTTTTLSSAGYCECAYNQFVTMVPYNDSDRTNGTYKGYPDSAPVFTKLNNDLKDDPNKFNDLPQNIRDAIASCKSANVTTGPTAAAAAPTTTTTG